MSIINQLKLNVMSIVISIVIGIAAGFIAGKIVKGTGFGLVLNLIVGLVGGLLGGWLFGLIGLNFPTILGTLITATVGAVVLLWLLALILKK